MRLYPADDLGLYPIGLGDVDDLLGMALVEVDFHAVAHVEDLVHFLPVSTAFLLNDPEQGRSIKQVVLDHMDIVHKMEDFGLCPAAAMHQSVDMWAHVVEHIHHDGGIGSGGGKHQLAHVHRSAGSGIGQVVFSAVNQAVGNSGIETFGIFCLEDFVENVMPRRSQPIAAHPAVVFGFIVGLAKGGQAHDHVSPLDFVIGDDFVPSHPAGDCAVHDNGPHQIPHIGRFASGQDDIHPVVTEHLEYFFRALDDGGDDLAGNQVFVSANGGGNQDIVDRPDTQQVVGIHDDGVLGDAFPDAQITGFFPIEVGQG